VSAAAVPPLAALTEDIAALAAFGAASLDEVLKRALDSLQCVVPYDLAAIFELDRDQLRVRTALGRLADERVRRHRIDLGRFPTIQQAMETRRPVALLEHHHSSDEGDPYDNVLDLPHGHSCMVVPLYSGDRALGVMTFDRAICEPYRPEIVELAGVFGQLLALAILYAEQAASLERQRHRLREQNRLLREESGGGSAAATCIEETRSPVMARLVRQARQVASTVLPVLIQGETGVGKELLARAVHEWSGRREEGLVTLNCAAIPDSLIESELFGHVRGAFTGAASARAGRFLTANGGTLFLDEIGEMPLPAQAKLLRVLQEGTFEPLGSDRTIKVDVRIIAATNVDLEAAVDEGRFRQDLFYRLDVFPLEIPPLRERPEDIGPISASVLGAISRRTGRGPWALHPEAVEALARHPFPGNVRQLVNALERATIVSPGGVIGVDDLLAPSGRKRRPVVADAPASGASVPLEEMERRYIGEVLLRTGGRIYGRGGAAEVLGLKPTTLQSRLRKLGIERRAAAPSPVR
jgi:transcriptional regulator with GAF, ATPase, and Fis domain